MSKFERDTSVREVDAGVFEGQVNRDWWIVFGPNGGFLAAMLVRAMSAAVGDPGRAARSLTIHYTAAPAEGPVRIRTTAERAGRSLTTVSARMEQADRLIALAIGAFSRTRLAAIEFDEAPAPDVPPPEDVPLVEPHPQMPPFSRQWEVRPAIGTPPFTGANAPALTGGWIRAADTAAASGGDAIDPQPVDAALIAQLADAWIPAVFVRLAAPNPVPTIDLTIHFRADLPLPADYLLVSFESRLSRGGFIEEDGAIWSRDGRLVAHSRQLALLQAPSQD
jgi:acyl-CoA thioesterase